MPNDFRAAPLAVTLALLGSLLGFAWVRGIVLSTFELSDLLAWGFSWLLLASLLAWQAAHPYRYGSQYAQMRDGLFKLFSLMVAIALGIQFYQYLLENLARHWFGQGLETLAQPAAVCAGLAAGLLPGVVGLFLPDELDALRLQGRIPAAPAWECLGLGAAWMLLTVVVLALSAPPGFSFSLTDATQWLLSGGAATAVYAIIRVGLSWWLPTRFKLAWQNRPRLLPIPETPPHTVWLIFERPVTRQEDGELIDLVARRWQRHPIVLMAPAGGDVMGEHLRLSHRQNHLKTLFPAAPILLNDWLLRLPPKQLWQALPYREIYPVRMPVAEVLGKLRGKEDEVLLMAKYQTPPPKRTRRYSTIKILWPLIEILTFQHGYRCANYGHCAFADEGRRFTWSGHDIPICPVCGRSGYIRRVGDLGLPTWVGNKWLWRLAGACGLVFVLAGHRDGTRDGGDTSPVIPNSAHSSPVPPSHPSPKLKPNPPTTPIVHPELFGLIEIGGKGVKAIVIDLALTEREKDTCQKDEEAYAECVRRSSHPFEPYNTTPVEKKAMEDTVKAARKFFDEMTKTHAVDPRHIYLVGSSSIGNLSLVPHRDELRKALEDGLSQGIEMDFVTAEEEGKLGFYGTLQLIREKWRAKRKTQALVLDIGSGDTKGGYLEIRNGREEFVPVAVPWGTKTFTNEVEKQMDHAKVPKEAFPEWAARLRISLLRPAIHDEVSRKPGLLNRGRVYLIGGIAWATSTLVHPEIKGPFSPMHPEYFDTLYNRAILPNAAARIYSDDLMASYPAIGKVSETFTPDNLVAGLEILRTFADEMQFKRKDKLFFIRDSLYAWPLGYITHRCQQENTCRP